MQLDAVTAEIRPRSDWEAVDLGFAMVRRSFWRCIAVWWLALGVPMALAGWLLWQYPLVMLVVFWWCKPVGSRMVLFEISRRLFGEEPNWRSILLEIPRAWVRRFFYRFLWARFSPWLPVTMAVEDLEGLRGKMYQQRCGQVVRRGEGVVMWLYLVSDVSAAWLGLGILGLLMMLIPEGQGSAWQLALESWDSGSPWDLPELITRTVVGCVIVGMSLTDVFVTGAGFGIYINNRTWIEGWDVELAFRRLGQRLGKVALMVMSILMVSQFAGAEEARMPIEVIQEVKADGAFKVHTVTERVPKPSSRSGLPLEWVGMLMQLFAICAVALLVGAFGWMLWKKRHLLHLFRMGSRGLKEAVITPTARVVMGLEVTTDTLPEDVPTAAWMLWQQGRHQESLGLLYRGAISRVIQSGQVEIQESDTEGDCLRRVEQVGTAVHPGYFRGITGAWSQLAYAGVSPPDAQVEALCREWPFGEGRIG